MGSDQDLFGGGESFRSTFVTFFQRLVPLVALHLLCLFIIISCCIV